MSTRTDEPTFRRISWEAVCVASDPELMTERQYEYEFDSKDGEPRKFYSPGGIYS